MQCAQEDALQPNAARSQDGARGTYEEGAGAQIVLCLPQAGAWLLQMSKKTNM